MIAWGLDFDRCLLWDVVEAVVEDAEAGPSAGVIDV